MWETTAVGDAWWCQAAELKHKAGAYICIWVRMKLAKRTLLHYKHKILDFIRRDASALYTLPTFKVFENFNGIVVLLRNCFSRSFLREILR